MTATYSPSRTKARITRVTGQRGRWKALAARERDRVARKAHETRWMALRPEHRAGARALMRFIDLVDEVLAARSILTRDELTLEN